MIHELQYLSGKDLEYFEKMRDEGGPVRIIYLDPEVLDRLSIDDIEKIEKESAARTGHQVTEAELEEWLKEHKAIKEPEKEEEKQNGQQNGQKDGKQ